jgi:hypothetical protein
LRPVAEPLPAAFFAEGFFATAAFFAAATGFFLAAAFFLAGAVFFKGLRVLAAIISSPAREYQA